MTDCQFGHKEPKYSGTLCVLLEKLKTESFITDKYTPLFKRVPGHSACFLPESGGRKTERQGGYLRWDAVGWHKDHPAFLLLKSDKGQEDAA